MKKILCMALIAIIALSCAVAPAFAESHPLMYKVTDQDGHTIYLLGTLHVINQETLPIAGLDDVLGKVDTVIFELNEADMEKIVSGELAQASATDGMSLLDMFVEDNGLSEDTANLVAGFLTAASNQEVDPEIIRHLALPALTQMLQAQFMQLAGYDATGHGVDDEVFRKAKALGKKIEGPESLQDQMKVAADMVNAAASEQQIQEMMMHPEAIKEQMDGIVNAYNNGDKDALLKILTAEGTRDTSDAGRNDLFLETAKKALADGGNALIAIGSYHIIAEDGLVNTLTQAGCTVEKL